MSFKHGFRAGSRGPAFAASTPEASQQAGVRQLVTFHLDGEEFAVEILKVQEIIRRIDTTRVPNAPDFVEGVINLRGKVVPVICLRKRFGLPARDTDNFMPERLDDACDVHGNDRFIFDNQHAHALPDLT